MTMSESEPLPTDRYFLLPQDESPYLHLRSDCLHLNHKEVHELSTASIVPGHAINMKLCNTCVPAAHKHKLKQARDAREEKSENQRAGEVGE